MDSEAEGTPNIRRFIGTRGRPPPPSDWVVDISNSLKRGTMYDLGRSWTIYRVPRSMKEEHGKAFVPNLISIGPYHRGNQSLLAMEEHKMLYLLRFMGYSCNECGPRQRQVRSASAARSTATGTRPEVVLRFEQLKAVVRPMEQRARNCYAEFVNMGSDEFVGMMVVDGCFLIELLRFYYRWDKAVDQEVPVEDDPIFSTRWMLRTLQRDLLMLENQIPFFVLKELFNFKLSSSSSATTTMTTTTTMSEEPSLIDLVITFFDPILPRDHKRMPNLDPPEEFDHMLGVFWSTFLRSVREKVTETAGKLRPSDDKEPPVDIIGKKKKTLVEKRQLIHSDMELQKAGIELKMKEGGADLLDISFEGHVLEVPPLYIDGNTLKMFLNFVAYEQQCVQKAKPYFTNYFMFFDCLINSKKDVEVLHENGIINHASGTRIEEFINKLGRNTVYDLDECYLSKEISEIEKFCRGHKWRMWWSELIRVHFSSPWTALALAVAIFVLLLQMVQTWYSIAPYYRSGS